MTPPQFAQQPGFQTIDTRLQSTYLFQLGNVDQKEYLRKEWFIQHMVSPYVVWRLSEMQHSMGIYGSVGEIGVHYGGFFLALAVSSAAGEQPFAIDIFDQKHLNVDGSGKGAWRRFSANVRMLDLDAKQFELDGANRPHETTGDGTRRDK